MTSIANKGWSAEMASSAASLFSRESEQPDTDKQAVGQHFGRAARSYDANAELQLMVGRTLVQRLPKILAVPRALDLGCATAPFARAQQEALPAVVWQAVDLSEAMLEEARERGRLNAQYRPLCADAENLPVASASQGLVFSCFALQWCDPWRVLAETSRVLAPGGKLLLAVPLAGSLRELHDSWQAVDRRPHVNALPAVTDWLPAARDAGLTVQHDQQLAMVEHYPTVKAIARRLKATGADHVSGAAGLTGKNAWQAMVAEYERQRTGQGLPLTWQVLFLEAEKPDV